jgi:hypothetical protein
VAGRVRVLNVAFVQSLPDDLRKRLGDCAAKTGWLNNALSLAMHSPTEGGVLFLGDLPRSSLEALMTSGALHDHYEILLAPHHGTVALPAGFPPTTMCIAQAGVHHHPNWRCHGPGAGCASTHEVGELTLDW